MLKAIIFDLGGVIQGLDWSPVVNALIDLKEDLDIDIYKAAFYYDRKNYFDLYATGKMDKKEFWSMVASRLGIDPKYIYRLSQSSELLYTFINHDLISLIKKLKPNHKLFVLANVYPEIETKAVRDNVYIHLFNKIYLSHNIGKKKPGKEAYLQILEENNLRPDECLFVDNDAKNIRGAKAIGMKALLYGSVDSLKLDIFDHLTKNNQKRKKEKIGYTTGVFDLLHQGHLNLLKNAKKHCDKLVVGLTTDELSLSFKGKTPLVPLSERMAIVKAIKYVDAVVPQNEMDKFIAWEKYQFDVMFASNTPTKKWPLVQAEFLQKFKAKNLKPPEIINLPYTPGVSSTIRREILKKVIIESKN
jgi:glycerol-3-phosphate cytidylyltransferase